MGYLPAYVGVLVLAGVAGHALCAATEWIATGQLPRPLHRLFARARGDRPVSEPMPAILLELELQRLAGELLAVRGSDRQGRALRITACTIAYDDALVQCCRGHGIDAPDEPRPLLTSQRVDAEASLLAAGVSW